MVAEVGHSASLRYFGFAVYCQASQASGFRGDITSKLVWEDWG